MPQPPTLREMLISNNPTIQGLKQVGVPQAPNTGPYTPPPEQPGYFDNYLSNVVNFLKTALPEGPTPYEQSLAGASHPVSAVSQAPIQHPAPQPTGQTSGDISLPTPQIAAAPSQGSPFAALPEAQLNPPSRQSFYTPTPAEEANIQAKQNKMNTTQALASLAALKSPENFTGRV